MEIFIVLINNLSFFEQINVFCSILKIKIKYVPEMNICNRNKKLQTHRNKALKYIMCIVKVTGLWLKEKHLDKDKQP